MWPSTVLGVIISKDDMVVGGMEIYIYIYICKIVSIETKVIWFRWLSSFVFYLKSELRVAGDKNQSMCVYIYIYICFEYVDFLCELIMKKLLVSFSSLSLGWVLLFVHVICI